MRLNTRTTAYLLTAVAAVALGGGLTTAAFAGSAPPVVENSQLERQPDGATVLRPTLPFVVEENTTVDRRADGSFLIPPHTPIEVLPGGGLRIG